jgi:hypothetical protein
MQIQSDRTVPLIIISVVYRQLFPFPFSRQSIHHPGSVRILSLLWYASSNTARSHLWSAVLCPRHHCLDWSGHCPNCPFLSPNYSGVAQRKKPWFRYGTVWNEQNFLWYSKQCCRSGIRCFFWPLDPGWVFTDHGSRIPDFGSRIQPIEIWELKKKFWVKIINIFFNCLKNFLCTRYLFRKLNNFKFCEIYGYLQKR